MRSFVFSSFVRLLLMLKRSVCLSPCRASHFVSGLIWLKWDLILCGLLFNYAWLKGKLWYLSSYSFWQAIITDILTALVRKPAACALDRAEAATLRCVKLWNGNWVAAHDTLECALLRLRARNNFEPGMRFGWWTTHWNVLPSSTTPPNLHQEYPLINNTQFSFMY